VVTRPQTGGPVEQAGSGHILPLAYAAIMTLVHEMSQDANRTPPAGRHLTG
jgi:hypothetical protein